jgi:hypothetical protein
MVRGYCRPGKGLVGEELTTSGGCNDGRGVDEVDATVKDLAKREAREKFRRSQMYMLIAFTLSHDFGFLGKIIYFRQSKIPGKKKTNFTHGVGVEAVDILHDA